MADEQIALILDPNADPLLVPREEALEAYKKYLDATLENDLDIRLFAALTVAIATMSKPSLVYASGEKSFAETKLEEWGKAAA